MLPSRTLPLASALGLCLVCLADAGGQPAKNTVAQVTVSGTAGVLNISGASVVRVGQGSLANIRGFITVRQPYFPQLHSSLVIDDSADLNPATATFGNYFGPDLIGAAGLAPAGIFGDSTVNTSIKGSTLAVQTFTVNNRAGNALTDIDAGIGAVQVLGTGNDLAVRGSA